MAVDAAERKLGTTSDTWDIAQHRLGLLRGEPSRVERHLRDNVDNLTTSGLHLFVKEAIDAGAGALAIVAARGQAERGPFCQAVLAATEAAVSSDEDRWHDALRIAAEHGLRLIIVDALEGLVAAVCPLRELGRVPSLVRRRPAATGRMRLPVALRARRASLGLSHHGRPPTTGLRSGRPR